MLWHISKLFLFLTPVRNMRGSFSYIHWENQVKLLEVKFTKLSEPLMTGAPWRFSLRLVHAEPPAIHQLQYRFPSSGIDSWSNFHSSKLWFSVFAHDSFHFQEHESALWPHFSYRFKKICWFFSLFSFCTCCKDGAVTFKPLTQWTRNQNWKSILFETYLGDVCNP